MVVEVDFFGEAQEPIESNPLGGLGGGGLKLIKGAVENRWNGALSIENGALGGECLGCLGRGVFGEEGVDDRGGKLER